MGLIVLRVVPIHKGYPIPALQAFMNKDFYKEYVYVSKGKILSKHSIISNMLEEIKNDYLNKCDYVMVSSHGHLVDIIKTNGKD